MLKAFCDICGKEIDKGIFREEPKQHLTVTSYGVTDITMDLCKRCTKLAIRQLEKAAKAQATEATDD